MTRSPRVRQYAARLAAVIVALACSPVSDASKISWRDTSGPPDPLASGIVEPRQLSAEEVRLIGQVERMFPGTRGQDLKRRLSDRRVFSVRLSAHPEAQLLIDSIMAIRRAEAMALGEGRVASTQLLGAATIAIAERWDPANGVAVVVMRAAKPNEYVLLLPPDATAANVGAAMRAISSVAGRGARPEGDARIVVTDAHLPESWKENGTARFVDGILAGTRARPLREVSGIGPVRMSDMPVSLSRPALRRP